MQRGGQSRYVNCPSSGKDAHENSLPAPGGFNLKGKLAEGLGVGGEDGRQVLFTLTQRSGVDLDKAAPSLGWAAS